MFLRIQHYKFSHENENEFSEILVYILHHDNKSGMRLVITAYQQGKAKASIHTIAVLSEDHIFADVNE